MPAGPTDSLRRHARGVWVVLKDIVRGIDKDDCLGLAAEIAYYGLLSVFPFLLFLRSLVPYLPGKEQVSDVLLDGLAALVTTESRLYEIVKENIVEQVEAQSNALLSVSIILTIWAASNGFNILIKALNRAYGMQETRPWYKKRLLAIMLTIAAALFLPTSVTLVVLGPRFGETVAELTGAGLPVDIVWTILRWPIVLSLLVLVMALIYHLAPNRRGESAGWGWLSPGSLFAVGAIIGSSMGFSWFLSWDAFELRWLTYGAIGAVIVVLIWLYIMGLAVLVGGEINGAVMRARRKGWPPASLPPRPSTEEQMVSAEQTADSSGHGDDRAAG